MVNTSKNNIRIWVMSTKDEDIVEINDMIEKKFLHEHIDQEVNIFLTSGTKLAAEILEFDDVGIVTTGKDRKKKQLIYKTAISTIAEQ
jgi:RNA chaperone Hfq